MSLLFGLGSAVLATILGLAGIVFLRASIRMFRTDTTDAGAVSRTMDEVALSGTARPVDEPMSARFEDADTLLNSWQMAEYSGGSGSGWVPQESGTDTEPFLLDDGTGAVLVDPEGAEWVIDVDHTKVVDEDMPPRPIREFLAEVDRMPNAEKDGAVRKRRYREKRLDPGGDVFVYGPVKEGSVEGVPGPYVGTDSTDRNSEERVAMRLSPSLLPFVGDPGDTLSLGGAGETGVFTVSDSAETDAKRRYLKRAGILVAFSAWFYALGVWLLFY